MCSLTLKPSPEQEEVIRDPSSCLLVTGKPGSGKTMAAILKARAFAEKNHFRDHQKVLILTFSRTAVFQLLEKGKLLGDTAGLEIDTYHAFFLHLVQQFGKYAGFSPGRIRLLLTGERKAMVEQTRNILEENKKTNTIHFDEFCSHAVAILRNSNSIQKCLWRTYPLVIVDEFQDTNDEQWEFIKLLTGETRLVCFAGPGQMIYRHLKANPQRLQHLKEWRKSVEIILSSKNFRDPSNYFVSLGQIVLDPHRMVTIAHDRSKLEFESVKDFYARGNHLNGRLQVKLKWKIKNYQRGRTDMSIGVLAYTNDDSKRISEAFLKRTTKGPIIHHRLAEDDEVRCYLEDLIIRGWKYFADDSIADTQELDAIIHLFRAHGEQGLLDNRKLTAQSMLQLRDRSRDKDFESYVRSFCEEFGSDSQKREGLSSRTDEIVALFNELKVVGGKTPVSRDFERFVDAKRVRKAVREKYLPFKGVHVMTLHKSKGKEFDLVVLLHFTRDPFIHNPGDEAQHRELLNVGMTRARKKLVIFYPQHGCCRPIKELVVAVKDAKM